jgi:hypothetical protein
LTYFRVAAILARPLSLFFQRSLRALLRSNFP